MVLPRASKWRGSWPNSHPYNFFISIGAQRPWEDHAVVTQCDWKPSSTFEEAYAKIRPNN